MNNFAKPMLVTAFVAIVLLFILFSGGMATGTMMSGGMMGGGMMGGGMMGGGMMGGGISWMWLPTLLTLGLGVLLGWIIWGTKPAPRT